MDYGPITLCKNSKKTNDPIPRKTQKPHFWAQIGPKEPKNFFFKIWDPSHLRVYGPLTLCKKSEKTNDPIPRKAQKPHFWAILGPKVPQKFFSEKLTSVISNGLWSPRFMHKIRKN